MENSKAGTKAGIGAGVLILIVAAMWALGKVPALAAPTAPSASPDVYKGTTYEGMTEAEAWAAYYQRKAEQEAERAAAIAYMEKYLEDPQKAEEESLAKLGITKAELPTYQDFALLVNMELGGCYINGVLTPPAGWTSSVTEWSRHVQGITNIRWHQMYG